MQKNMRSANESSVKTPEQIHLLVLLEAIFFFLSHSSFEKFLENILTACILSNEAKT